MGKDKWKRFRENETFDIMIQPQFEEIFRKDHELKGRWRSEFFKNDNPIVLELGCGRGEYTVALGELYPEKNFIGVDIKGARMWRGARTATDNGMKNIGFLRTRIEFIDSFFALGEVDEIWLTFPDPQLKLSRVKKRLTAPEFLLMYAKFLRADGAINLKTDSAHLHHYTKAVISHNGLRCEVANDDIYGSGFADTVLSVKTRYESIYLERGVPITYLKFFLDGENNLTAPKFEPDNLL